MFNEDSESKDMVATLQFTVILTGALSRQTSATLAEMEKAKITHFISPHLFYFKYDSCEENSSHLKVLENAIVRQVEQQRRLQPSREYRFKVGDFVSLYYLPWGRYLRAKVLEVLLKFSSDTDYIVWVHDYGFPVQTHGMALMPLSLAFQELKSLVYRGCLSDVIPVIFENGKVLKQSTEWSTKSCEKLKLLMNSENVFIEILYTIHNSFPNDALEFCKMEFGFNDNKRLDVIAFLENFQFGMRVEADEFSKFLQVMFLKDNVDWVNNDGTANFLINKHYGEQTKSPYFLQDWEKQPPFDEPTDELNMPAILEQNKFSDLSSPDDQQFSDFPRKCLAHSALLLSKRNSEKVFHAEICAELERMGIRSINVLQKYAWPHLQRGNSLFVISPKGSGKKWCYLPVICNLLQIFAYNIKDNSVLPLAIVVTASEARSLEIAMICRKLLGNIEIIAKDQLVRIGLDSFTPKNLQYVGILILTKQDILNKLTTDAFKKVLTEKPSYALILDNVTEIFRQNCDDETSLDKFIADFRLAEQSVEANQRFLQIIVTASEWKKDFLQTIQNTTYPLLLMSNFLEAAIYAKCPIIPKICQDADNKISLIATFVQKHQCLRIVVVCSNNNEAMEVQQALNRSGLCAFSYTSDHANELLKRWQNLMSNEAFICTDAELPQLCLSRVDKLVHYSLPESWSIFTERFSVLKDAFYNFIDKNVRRNIQLSSLILLDTNDLHLIPQLIQFFIKHNQSVSPKLLSLSTKLFRLS